MRRLTLLFSILLSISIFADNREMSTKYFRFIYDENYEREAIELAKSVDAIAEEQFKFFDFIPSEKVAIIMRDITDEENAHTLDNSIFLYSNSINTFDLEKTYDDWYVYVFTHELAHVIINRKVGGVFKSIPVFKYNLHQAFMPSWYHEGIAIYAEVKFTEDRVSGRELSKKFDMYIKDDVINREFEGLTFANGYYPNNDNYTHGYSFVKFFVDTYGEEALQKVIEETANHQIMQPFEAFLDVAEINTEEEMYRLWIDYLNKKYITVKNIREGAALVNVSDGTKRNLLARNGNLYYSNYNIGLTFDEYKKGIYKLDFEKDEEVELASALPVNGFDVKNEKLYYSTLFYDRKNMTNYAEAYRVDKTKRGYSKPKHIETDRAINMLYLEDEFAYVYREKQKQGLRMKNGKLLIAPQEGYLFQKLFYDELNYFIYFAATKVDEKISWIYEFNMETYEIKKIVKGYSPFIEGDELYFDNSMDGVFNVFKYNFESQDIVQLTNAEMGAFEPQVIDNNLYFLNYRNDTYTINKLEQDRYYNALVDESNFDEKEAVVEKKKEIVEREFDIEELKRKRFRNNMSYRYGYLIPGEIALTYSDQFWENFVTVGVSSLLHGKSDEESDTGVYYGEESYDESSGLLLEYKNNLVDIHAELSSDSYFELEYNHPILGKDHDSWFYAELAFNTDSERSIGAYAQKDMFIFSKQDRLGFRRTFDSEASDLNEFYVETPVYSVRLFISEEERAMYGALNEDSFVPLSEFGLDQIRYNIDASQLLLVNGKIMKPYPANRGSVSGTMSVKDYFTLADLYALTTDSEDMLFVYDLSVGGNGFIFTHWPVTLSTGILGQVDLEEMEMVDDSSELYFKYKIEL